MQKYASFIFIAAIITNLLTGVLPVGATMTAVSITHIQAGGVSGATEEFVAIYNNTSIDTEITDWCLKNKNNISIACFTPSAPSNVVILPAYSYAVVASSLFVATRSTENVIVYEPHSQGSGSIVASSDRISLVKPDGETVDSHSWSVLIPTGSILERMLQEGADPIVFYDTDEASNWTLSSQSFVPVSSLFEVEDVHPQPLDPLPLLKITEVFPNPKGADAGKEFIELFNSSDEYIILSRLILWIGQYYEKSYSFNKDVTLEPGGRMIITNADMPFTLVNTASRVRITTEDGRVVDETEVYFSPKDDQSWSLIDGVWQYTAQPTPGEPNVMVIKESRVLVSVVPKPCAANQYRSPETNRCRLIQTAQKSPTPCKENQYRSPETNRCRNIVATTLPTPCKEGQERNPETNRCRTIKKMTEVDYGVLDAHVTQSGGNWYMWAAIACLIMLAIAYGVWEWREELRKLWRSVIAKLSKRTR